MKVESVLCLIISLLVCAATTARAESWPCWRGPRGDGRCIEKDVPINWNPAAAVWKAKLPGKGHASLIVWGGRVFTVTALPETR